MEDRTEEKEIRKSEIREEKKQERQKREFLLLHEV
jgi:hypothetical protein